MDDAEGTRNARDNARDARYDARNARGNGRGQPITAPSSQEKEFTCISPNTKKLMQ